MLDCNGLVTIEVQQGQTKQYIGAARCRPFGTEPAGKKRGRGVGDGGRKSEKAAEAAARHFCLFRTPPPPEGGRAAYVISGMAGTVGLSSKWAACVHYLSRLCVWCIRCGIADLNAPELFSCPCPALGYASFGRVAWGSGLS